jgi:hypothetical protein
MHLVLDGKARPAHDYPANTVNLVYTKAPVTTYANQYTIGPLGFPAKLHLPWQFPERLRESITGKQ